MSADLYCVITNIMSEVPIDTNADKKKKEFNIKSYKNKFFTNHCVLKVFKKISTNYV